MNLYMHPFDFSEKWKFIVTPLLGEGGKNVMGVWGWSQGMCLYICFHIKAYLVANWIWSNFRKVKIHRNPLLGGRGGQKCYKGCRLCQAMCLKKIQIKAYLAVHLMLIKFPPYTPTLQAPLGNQFTCATPISFMVHMIVDTLRISNVPKSAYRYFH